VTSPLLSDPVVSTAWHPVATGGDLRSGQVRAVRLLGEDLVLWRGEDRVHAWQDLCVHRGVKLSLGRIAEGNSLRCAYHGWTYGENGQCIRMPAHPGMKPPLRARVRTYPCAERAGLIWVSLGGTTDQSEERTRAPDIPSLAEGEDPAFRAIPCGPYSAPAGAPRLIENFLDVAHLPIVHEGFLGVSDQAEILPYEVAWEDGLPVARDIRLFQPNPEGLQQAGPVAYEYGVLSPFAVYLRKRLTGGRCFTLLFAVAPVSEVASEAFFTVFMNYGDPAEDAGIVAFQEKIFAQDLPIVGSQRPERLPLDLAAEMHLPSDRLAIAYRQYLRAAGLSFGTA
jgi:phenylpropionate dioxygenase-like ring-hydroxylating dioxygenase large terminal subunit